MVAQNSQGKREKPVYPRAGSLVKGAPHSCLIPLHFWAAYVSEICSKKQEVRSEVRPVSVPVQSSLRPMRSGCRDNGW